MSPSLTRILLTLLASVSLAATPVEPPPTNAEALQSPSPAGTATRSVGVGGEGRGEGGPPPASFTDVTAAAGITFVHSNGATGEKLLPETMGGGVAFFDYDGDGDSDLLFVDSAGEHTNGAGVVLYQNDGTGRFTDVTQQAGLAAAVRTSPEEPFTAFYGMGVAAADYDGDGWIDLYLTAVGPNRLLRNRWGHFEDVTEQAGVSGEATQKGAWSTGAAFFDADGDGDLDLFVCNYLEWSPEIDRDPARIAERTVATVDGSKILTYGRPQTYRGAHLFLFLNNGPGPDGVTFTEVAREAGLHVTHPGSDEPVAKALAVAPTDVDGDRRTDLLLANDTTRNLFFHNRGPGENGQPRFEEVGELWGLAYDPDGNTTGAMGVDWGYLDTSGPRRNDLSILVGNFADEATSLYRAQGDPTFFADEAQQAGIATATTPALTFGLLLLDYDLDGRLDLLQANGHVEPDIDKIDPAQTYRQPAQLFWHVGRSRQDTALFVEPAPESMGALVRPLAGRGAAHADFDGDGDPDLAQTQIAGPPLLIRNDQVAGHRWLRVALAHRPSSPTAAGARIEVTAAGAVLWSELQPARSYLSQAEYLFTAGLGVSRQTDRLELTWPDGHHLRLDELPADRTYVLYPP